MNIYSGQYAHRLCEEIADALLQACLVVVMLLPSDQCEGVQNLHDDLKEIGRGNLMNEPLVILWQPQEEILFFLPGIRRQLIR